MSEPVITPKELLAELQGPSIPVLLDVREAFELEISQLPGVVHIPMAQVESRIAELDPSADTVVICRTGRRSEEITNLLIASGFVKVRNLERGMNGIAPLMSPPLEVY